jgi:hypothetical protein
MLSEQNLEFLKVKSGDTHSNHRALEGQINLFANNHAALKKQLNDLYSSPTTIRVIKPRRMRRVGHVVGIGESRGAYRILVGRPEGRRPLGRPRRRWEDNTKTDLQEVGWGMDWIELAQDGTCGGLLYMR